MILRSFQNQSFDSAKSEVLQSCWSRGTLLRSLRPKKQISFTTLRTYFQTANDKGESKWRVSVKNNTDSEKGIS